MAFDGGKGDYHALQIKVERRYTRGLYLLNSFTYSRARDNASGHLEVQNGDNSRVELPQPRRRTSASPATTSRSTTRPASCGSCRSAGTGSSASSMNAGHGRRPRRLAPRRHQHDDERRADQPVVHADGDVQRRRHDHLSSEPDGRSAHAERRGRQLPESRDGGRSRPIRRSRSATRRATWRAARRSSQLDLGLHKSFGLPGDGKRIEARIEAFNVLNKTNFQTANGNRSSTAFGTITSAFAGAPAAARREVLLLIGLAAAALRLAAANVLRRRSAMLPSRSSVV